LSKYSKKQWASNEKIIMDIWKYFSYPQVIKFLQKDILKGLLQTGENGLEIWNRTIFYGGRAAIEEERKYLESSISEYIPLHVSPAFYMYTQGGVLTKKIMKYSGLNLRGEEYILTEWANAVYDLDKDNKFDTCAVKFMTDKFPQYYRALKKIETPKGITIKDFTEFCDNKQVAYKLYNELGKLKFDNKLKVPQNEILNGFIYNNHVLPFKGTKPRRVAHKKFDLKLIDNAAKEFKKYLKMKKLPFNIKIADKVASKEITQASFVDILSFQTGKTKYLCNKEYSKCLHILTNMGYKQFAKDKMKVTDIPGILEKAFGM
jgi:hypothetical protein